MVDDAHPSFDHPTKFIGPVYSEDEAHAIAARRGWRVARDGRHWRRVVPSPEPRHIVQLPAIQRLVHAGFLVVCAGGDGVPVVDDGTGGHRGVEAVIDIVLSVAPGSSQDDANVIALAMWRTSFGGANDFGLGSAIAVFLCLLVVPALAFNIRRFRREEA